jgi:hypothetical protein
MTVQALIFALLSTFGANTKAILDSGEIPRNNLMTHYKIKA